MKFNFQIGIEVENETGELMSAYFQIRKGNVAETKEYQEGDVFADYNARGDLLGIEVLGPCRVTVLDRIAKDKEAKKFVRRVIPRELELV